MFEFEWRATYFVLLRAKPILASLGMPKWVWFSMKWHSMFFVRTSTLPPSMYPNLNEYGRYCKQPNLVTCLKCTPICEWCVGRCGSYNGHQKDMCLKGIGIWSQNLSTIIGSIIDIKWKRESSLLFDLNVHRAPNIIRKVVAGTIWIC